MRQPKKKVGGVTKDKRTGLSVAKKKAALLEALEQSLGVVTTACKAIGVGRDFYYDHMKSDPVFRQKVEDLANVTLDFAESHLHKRIKSGSDACTIFLLKTKGRGRGYIEHREWQTTDPSDPQVFKIGDQEIRF